MEPKQKNVQAGAYANIMGAAFLWGILGLWNRKLMAVGVSPISIVVIRSIGGMLLLCAIFGAVDKVPVHLLRAEKWQ